MKKSSKIIITLLVIILVAILGVGGYLIATLNKKVSEQSNEIAGLKNEAGNSAEVENVVEVNSIEAENVAEGNSAESQASNSGNGEVLNIELTDSDLYANGFGNMAFIENGEVYYAYRDIYAQEGARDCIIVKKISGVKDAVSVKSYALATDVSKDFFIITESGKLYRIGENYSAERVFEDYEIQSIVSAEGEWDHEYVFILKDNRKVKINTDQTGEITSVEELGKYSSVNITGNKGNVQSGTDLYTEGYLSSSFIINGNVYVVTFENVTTDSLDYNFIIEKVDGISDVKNIKALTYGGDAAPEYFVVKTSGEVYNFFYSEKNNVTRTECLKDYSVETIIGVESDDCYDGVEIKVKLKDGSTVNVVY